MHGHIDTTPGLTRRRFIERAMATGLAATVAGALPVARGLVAPGDAQAAEPALPDATLQAFYDTMIPGRRVATTVLGDPVHPRAILGLDDHPGAVETDALALGRHPLIGFDVLAPAFLADLEVRALAAGGAPFLLLDHAGREAAATAGLSFDNPLRLLWEAAAAIPFTAFCAAGLSREQTADDAPGYRVMGLPGRVSAGYADASYRRRLSRERTRSGNLP